MNTVAMKRPVGTMQLNQTTGGGESPSRAADSILPGVAKLPCRKRGRIDEGDSNDSISCFREQLRQFANDRDWNQFHTPKNLSMALTGEVGELMELMQWRTDEEILRCAGVSDGGSAKDPVLAEALGDEVADVFLYLLRLSDILGLDIGRCASEKIRKNALKYPVDLAKGNAKKYAELRRTTA